MQKEGKYNSSDIETLILLHVKSKEEKPIRRNNIEKIYSGSGSASVGLKKLKEFYTKDEDKNYWLKKEKIKEVEYIINEYYKNKLAPHYSKVKPFVENLLIILVIMGMIGGILFSASFVKYSGKLDKSKEVFYAYKVEPINHKLNCTKIDIDEIDNQTIYEDKECNILFVRDTTKIEKTTLQDATS